MWVIGGADGSVTHSDTYYMDLHTAQWIKRKTTGQVPLFGQASCVVGQTLFVFGGNDGKSYHGDLWSTPLDPRVESHEWKPHHTSGTTPSPRAYSTAIYHDSRIIAIGGFDGKKCYGDVHHLDLSIYSYLDNRSRS
jgi:N-acetylneuraminic acid mutarotase